MVQWNETLFVLRFFQRDMCNGPAFHNHQSCTLSRHQQFYGFIAEFSGQNAVYGNGSTASLDMTEGDRPGFDSCLGFDIVGNLLADPPEPDWVGAGGIDTVNYLLASLVSSTFGNADDAEAFAPFRTIQDKITDFVYFERYFGEQNDVRAAGNPGMEGDPSRIPSHDLNDHDTVVACGSCVHAV